MRTSDRDRKGIGALELLLIFAVVLLCLQLFPSILATLWNLTLRTMDVRTWSRQAWFLLNLAVVIGLVALRYNKVIVGSLRDFVNNYAARRATARQERSQRENAEELEKQRRLFERLREARKRQVY